jgi:hypothetical protein
MNCSLEHSRIWEPLSRISQIRKLSLQLEVVWGNFSGAYVIFNRASQRFVYTVLARPDESFSK